MFVVKYFFQLEKIILFLVSISIISLFNFFRLVALETTIAECSVLLSDQENTVIKGFAQILENEGYRRESHFYHHVSNEKFIARSVLLKKDQNIFVLAPTSIFNLGSNYILTMIDAQTKQKIEETNLVLIAQTSLISIYQIPYSNKYNNFTFWKIQNPIKQDNDPIFANSSQTILTTEEKMPIIKTIKGKPKLHLLGSIVFGKNLNPIGFFTYHEGLVHKILFQEVIDLINAQSPRSKKNNDHPEKLIETAKKFVENINEKNVNSIGEFFSHTCLYQFGPNAYLYLRSLFKPPYTVTRNDLKKTGLTPFKKALSSFIILNNEKKNEGLKFRILVSFPENPKKIPAIVTFSMDQNIIPTRWKLYEEGWKLDSLPVPMKDLLLFLTLQKSNITLKKTPLTPFSGLTTGIGMDFFPKQNIPGFFVGYYKNFAKYSGMNINISYDPISYHHSYKNSENLIHSYEFVANFLSIKPSLVIHYPFIFKNQFYLMAYLGLELACAFLLTPVTHTHKQFDKLLIKRLPLTLLTGWTSGIEFGFRSTIPMALGLHLGYQSDFFGQQTVKKHHNNTSLIRGSANQYYIFLYYKISLHNT